jgi:hypothetical protein
MTRFALVVAITWCACPSTISLAQVEDAPDTVVACPGASAAASTSGVPHEAAPSSAFEVNVLWPFVPGGIVVLRALVPVLLADRGDLRGELFVGAYADFAWRIVRGPTTHGDVGILALVAGWRQFLVYGLHIEAMLMAGWRNELRNPYDGQPIDAFQGRLFVTAGYQHELSRVFYVNLRGGVGVHVFRTDRFADREQIVVPTADVNIGARFEWGRNGRQLIHVPLASHGLPLSGARGDDRLSGLCL